MKFYDAKLIATAANKAQWPQSSLNEIAFVGRSNAGKSSLINSLLNRKNLAYAGKTPGKTRLLNFYEVNKEIIFMDAPGYGYAIKDKQAALFFSNLIDPYFNYRENLKAMVIVLDARREPSVDDITMVEYAKSKHLAIIAACTKKDKLSNNQLHNNLFKISKALGIPKANLKPCSSLSKEGLEEIWEEINKYI